MRLRELLACVPRRFPPSILTHTHNAASHFFFLRVWNEAFVESFRPMEKNARGPSRRTRWTAENKRADEGKKKIRTKHGTSKKQKKKKKKNYRVILAVYKCVSFFLLYPISRENPVEKKKINKYPERNNLNRNKETRK